MHPVTPLLSVLYLWHPILPSLLSLCPFVSLLSPAPCLPPPSYHPHNCSVHSLHCEPSQTSGPLTLHTLQAAPSGEHVWAVRRTSRRTELKENTKQCPSVSLSTPTTTSHHHPEDPLIADKSNESGYPLRPWQKVWSLKCSHSSSPLCQKSLCAINKTNEVDVNVFNLLLLLCF